MTTNRKKQDMTGAVTKNQKEALQAWKRAFKYGASWVPRGSFEEFLKLERLINMRDGDYYALVANMKFNQAPSITTLQQAEGPEMGKKHTTLETTHAPTPQVKKKFHLRDLANIVPKTANQKNVFNDWKKYPDKHFFMHGSAGTGKTFLSMRLGLGAVLDPSTPYHKLIIVRSIVPAREIGYLPGTIEEKIGAYEEPYLSICDELFEFKRSYEGLKDSGYVEFVPTSYLRGVTFNNAIIIVDEIQNMNFGELDTIITRTGRDSKIMFCGDYRQNDLYGKRFTEESGFQNFLDIIQSMRSYFSTHEFGHDDICRSALVKDYIIQKENLFGDPRYTPDRPV